MNPPREPPRHSRRSDHLLTARTWARRGRTPVIQVRGRSSAAFSIAALACYKHGERAEPISEPLSATTAALRRLGLGSATSGGRTRWCRMRCGAGCGRSSAARTAISRSADRTTRRRLQAAACEARTDGRGRARRPLVIFTEGKQRPELYAGLLSQTVLCPSKIDNGSPDPREPRIGSRNPFSLKERLDPLLRLALCENPGS